MGLRRGHKIALVAQQVVQAAGQIITHVQRGNQHLFPRGTDHAAPVGDTDHQRFGACVLCFFQAHIGQAHIRAAARQAQLAYGVFGAPVLDALGHFCGQLVGRVAQKQKIWCFDHGKVPPSDCADIARRVPQQGHKGIAKCVFRAARTRILARISAKC